MSSPILAVKDRISNEITDCLCTWMMKARLQVKKECMNESLPGRTFGLLHVPSYHKGQYHAFYIRVVQPNMQNAVNLYTFGDLKIAQHAAQIRFDTFRDRSFHSDSGSKMHFESLIFKLDGGCDDAAANMIRTLAKQIARNEQRRWQPVEARMLYDLGSILEKGIVYIEATRRDRDRALKRAEGRNKEEKGWWSTVTGWFEGDTSA